MLAANDFPSFYIELRWSYWEEDFINELMHELLPQLRCVRKEHQLS